MGEQSSRIIQGSDGAWYYSKRGERPEGPYNSHRSAEQALERYIRGCQVRAEYGPLTLRWPRGWNPLRLLRKERAQRAAQRAAQSAG